MKARNTLISAAIAATFAIGATGAFGSAERLLPTLGGTVALQADEGVPRNLITAMKFDEGVPQNLVTALKADEGVPQNLITAMTFDEGVPQNLVTG